MSGSTCPYFLCFSPKITLLLKNLNICETKKKKKNTRKCKTQSSPVASWSAIEGFFGMDAQDGVLWLPETKGALWESRLHALGLWVSDAFGLWETFLLPGGVASTGIRYLVWPKMWFCLTHPTHKSGCSCSCVDISQVTGLFWHPIPQLCFPNALRWRRRQAAAGAGAASRSAKAWFWQSGPGAPPASSSAAQPILAQGQGGALLLLTQTPGYLSFSPAEATGRAWQS